MVEALLACARCSVLRVCRLLLVFWADLWICPLLVRQVVVLHHECRKKGRHNVFDEHRETRAPFVELSENLESLCDSLSVLKVFPELLCRLLPTDGTHPGASGRSYVPHFLFQ